MTEISIEITPEQAEEWWARQQCGDSLAKLKAQAGQVAERFGVPDEGNPFKTKFNIWENVRGGGE